MSGAAAKRRKFSRQTADDDQDASESSLEGNQDSTQPELPTHLTATTTGNGLSHSHANMQVRHLPSYPIFSTDSSRLFPEWSVPVPVGVPRGANGLLRSAWSQQQDVPASQEAQLQEAAPVHGAKDSVTQRANVLQASPEQLQDSQLVTIQSAPVLSRDQQSHHLSTGQVSLPQPSATTAPLHQPPAVAFADASLPSSAAPNANQSAPTAMQESAAVPQQEQMSGHDLLQQQQSSSYLQQQHSPSDQQPQQQTLIQPEQQQQLPDQLQPQGAQQHQQLLQQLPRALADAAADLDARNQQVGAGPSNQGSSAPNVGAYSQRELFLQNLEQAGDMSFEYVLNDGQRHNSIWLIALKNIFSKQLPNMPREYIARLVLDRRHRSVAIVRRKRNVVGGITYRPFHKQRFGEIAFCAVTANEQVKGFGTRLMNYTKEYAKSQDQLTHFLTYADNNAVGYFSKQGFTKEITLDKEWWVGYIKDYDGGTLMECVIVQRLPHTHLPAMLQAQKQALSSRIRQYSKSHVVHPGLSAFQEGCRRVDISSIPGVKDAGWDPGDSSGTGVKLLMNNSMLDATPNNLRHFMLMVVHELQQHEDAGAFLFPVSLHDVPDYLDIIKDPMDLSLMEQRLKRKDYYLTLDIFAADIRRICNNARIYNASDSTYYKSANRLEAFFDQYMHAHLLFG